MIKIIKLNYNKKRGQNMEFKSKIDENILKEKKEFSRKDFMKVIVLFKIAKINHKLKKYNKTQKYYEKIIEICNKYPKNENMLLFKIKSLKRLNKTYKSLENIENLLKINPYNKAALFMIANSYKGE